MFRFFENVKNSEISKRIKEKLFPIYPKPELKMAMERYRICDKIKKKSQINKEIHLYKKFWGCYPYDYFLADLYRADNQLTQEEIINYIPGFFWYDLYLPHHTAYKNSQIMDNKIFTEQLFKGLKISQPETLCMVINNNLYSTEMVKSTFNQIMQDIKKKNPEKFFVKPAEGYGGYGIYIFNKTGAEQYATRDNVFFNENFLSMIGKKSDFVIQMGVTQDPEFSAIYPDSVNTCRIVSENKEGKSRVVCAFMRLGRGQLQVDNVSSGGLLIKINTKTGKLGDYAMSYENEKFIKHPDTHFVFQNYKIPRWNQIERFVNDSANKIPLFCHLGWDIALTVNGPLAIETNLSHGIEATQLVTGGLREAFGIDDPDYYWKNLGKRTQILA